MNKALGVKVAMDPKEGHNFMVAAKPVNWILDLRAMDKTFLV